MFRHNSTIKIKSKPCKRCGRVGPIFSKGRCAQCAKIEDTFTRMEQEAEETIKEEGLQSLIKEADTVFSQWLRLSNADKNGTVSCYTCDLNLRWQNAHCGHYVKRGNLFLRFDPRNTRVQCEGCNVHKEGNYIEFTRRLEAEHLGITEYLMQEGALVYKPTRQEIKSIITEYSKLIKQLKQ